MNLKDLERFYIKKMVSDLLSDILQTFQALLEKLLSLEKDAAIIGCR